jgi:hypothetical protein
MLVNSKFNPKFWFKRPGTTSKNSSTSDMLSLTEPTLSREPSIYGPSIDHKDPAIISLHEPSTNSDFHWRSLLFNTVRGINFRVSAANTINHFHTNVWYSRNEPSRFRKSSLKLSDDLLFRNDFELAGGKCLENDPFRYHTIKAVPDTISTYRLKVLAVNGEEKGMIDKDEMRLIESGELHLGLTDPPPPGHLDFDQAEFSIIKESVRVKSILDAYHCLVRLEMLQSWNFELSCKKAMSEIYNPDLYLDQFTTSDGSNVNINNICSDWIDENSGPKGRRNIYKAIKIDPFDGKWSLVDSDGPEELMDFVKGFKKWYIQKISSMSLIATPFEG